ncbi:hypothetical protein BDZ97DRAFT_621220 [Flammula alnicola]|nr:hypothetical protein BDZ97DRAFT_621220 [Flammula alnicola]
MRMRSGMYDNGPLYLRYSLSFFSPYMLYSLHLHLSYFQTFDHILIRGDLFYLCITYLHFLDLPALKLSWCEVLCRQMRVVHALLSFCSHASFSKLTCGTINITCINPRFVTIRVHQLYSLIFSSIHQM